MEAEWKPVCVAVTVAEVENGGGGREVLRAPGENGVRLPSLGGDRICRDGGS